MRLSENTEKTLVIVLVSVMVFSLILALMSPIGTLRYIFGHIFLIGMVFIVVGIPILCLWPDNKTDWEWIKNKFRRKKK